MVDYTQRMQTLTTTASLKTAKPARSIVGSSVWICLSTWLTHGEKYIMALNLINQTEIRHIPAFALALAFDFPFALFFPLPLASDGLSVPSLAAGSCPSRGLPSKTAGCFLKRCGWFSIIFANRVAISRSAPTSTEIWSLAFAQRSTNGRSGTTRTTTTTTAIGQLHALTITLHIRKRAFWLSS